MREMTLNVPTVKVICNSGTITGEWKPPKDLYYDHEAEEKERKKVDDVSKLKQRQTYVKRVIVHPSFHNVSFGEAVKILAGQDQGESVIRPSSKGNATAAVFFFSRPVFNG